MYLNKSYPKGIAPELIHVLHILMQAENRWSKITFFIRNILLAEEN